MLSWSSRGRSAVLLLFASSLALSSATSRLARAEGDGDGEEPTKTAAQKEAERHYKRAKELYSLGRYREAIAQLEAALRGDPNAAELLFNLGLVHEKLGDVDEAVAAYKRYLHVLGDDADPEEKAKIESAIKRLEGAKTELRAREAKVAEHRFTTPAAVLLVGAGVGLLATGYVGYLASHDDKLASQFVVGSGGSLSDRQAIIDTSKRDAIIADVLGAASVAAAGIAFTLYFTSEYPKGGEGAPGLPGCGPTSSRLTISPIAQGAFVHWEMSF